MKHGFLVLIAASLVAASNLPAQDPLRAPDGGTATRVAGVDLLPIPGAPLTGKSNIEWTRTLEDGTTVTTHLQANLARDSEGRMYRERRSFTPVGLPPSKWINEITIFDPVAKTRTICTVNTKECVLFSYSPPKAFAPRPEGSFANGTRTLTRENLGTDVLEGLAVNGTLETTTVNAGVIGNDRPIVSTREFWYSPELQTNLKVVRDEPAIGKQIVLLTNISQGEPNPQLFKVPAGYTLRDARLPRRSVQ